MKERIYTIPVTEAFEQDSECPICILEKNLEDRSIEYYLGASLMEPDCRIETNKNGFCRLHFQMLYNSQENRLGLGLVTDTHIREQLPKLAAISKAAHKAADNTKDSNWLSDVLKGKGKLSSRDQSQDVAAKLIELLNSIENSCTICNKLDRTMERYMDVIMYLWSKEEDFKKIFASKKGFCLVHLKRLAEASVKYLKPRESAIFLSLLLKQQMENMERIEKELDWFTKKFDYRYNDAPWGNSRDALPRSIQKLKGYFASL
jgi:hypothetical protein